CFFFQAEDGIRDRNVTGVQTCALPIWGQPQPPEGGITNATTALATPGRSTPWPASSPRANCRATSEHGPREPAASCDAPAARLRSEERRVGKERRAGRAQEQDTEHRHE